jgi:hypothetical protein
VDVDPALPPAWDEQDLHAWQVLAPLRGGYLPWGDAALRPAGLVAVLNQVSIAEPGLVVECGAGISTLFLARLLRQRGRGRLVSVEHDERWVDWVARALAAEGLEGHALVVHAPLTGEEGWYDRERVDAAVGDGPIGVLLVDGPPACSTELAGARYPALPHFAARLAADAAVVVDDLWRPGEREVVRRWEAETPLRFELRPDRGHIAIGRVPDAAATFSF